MLHAVERCSWLTQQTIIGASHKSVRGLRIPTHRGVEAEHLSLRWQGCGSVCRRKLPSQGPCLARPKHSGPPVRQQQQVQLEKGRNNMEAAMAAFAKGCGS